MPSNAEIIHKFYTAFANVNAEEMASCYHDDIRFKDPAFGELYGEEARNMWRMLVRPGVKIAFGDIVVDDNNGSANWVAEYRFGKSQRPVINKIHAEFEFKDGKIIRHTDQFDFWNWSRQALGISGLLLGWTSWMRKKVRNTVRGRLAAFQKPKISG